ncbi:sugar transferase [Paenibacillus pinistramenti]|uniref:sugar transferase n=1 Tax=Paenibacillus pinistramenti TaxID=1768003 RepID=UPI001108597F|nr:sugar transferase [Paenibacillus pinistramenti]
MPKPNLPEEMDYAMPAQNVFYKRYEDAAAGPSPVYLFLKRVLDILLACIGLVLTAPVFLIAAICIKVEDPKGSVFFKQTRVGKDERPFEMYKFRSMVSNAEELKKDLLKYNEVSGAMFKMKNDPRITRTGRFLRKTSIDELPQLWNVLTGSMSLVGPRPPLPDEVAQYTDYQKQRLTVTPGCTGFWQVSARNSVGFEEMVQMDLAYIRKRSLLLDIKIIFLTAYRMILSKDAY